MTRSTLLEMYVIYRHPEDYPDQWVARRWALMPGGDEMIAFEATVGDTYSDVVAAVPAGYIRTDRDPFDPPCVHEVWL